MHSNLKLLFSLFVTLTFAVSASGEEKVLLKQKLQTGKTYTIEQSMEMNSQIAVPGSDEAIEQDMEMNMTMDLAVSQPKPEEKAISIKFTDVKTTVDMMGQTIEMDASDPAQKETLGPIMDLKPVLFYDNDDNFLRAEGLDEMAAGNPMAGAVDAESLKQMVTGMMGVLPAKAVAPGHTWESNVNLPIPNMGEMKMLIKNVFEKYETIDGNKCAVIKFSGSFAGKVDQEGVAIKFEKGSSFNGTYHFDPAIGYSRKQVMDMNLVMGMNIEGETMEVPMKIKQTVDLVKVRDN